jgi:hypothetical protein
MALAYSRVMGLNTAAPKRSFGAGRNSLFSEHLAWIKRIAQGKKGHDRHGGAMETTLPHTTCPFCGHPFTMTEDVLEHPWKRWLFGNDLLLEVACPLCDEAFVVHAVD